MNTSVTLSGGQRMPLLGLGCWQAPSQEVAAAVKAALLAGYRHIDTAYNYLNEDGVGEGIRAALKTRRMTRRDLFVVTKLPMIAMQEGKVEKYLKKSLKLLGLDYVDLYLVHTPFGCVERSETDVFPSQDGKLLIDCSTDLIAVWKEMEKMVKLGLAKSIGVSNFNAKQVLKIVSNAEIPPAVHQVECHVYFQQRALREACKKHNIAITAYAPLGSPGRKVLYESRGATVELPDLLNNPVVRLVAEKHKRTAAQVLLRFLAQQDIIVIPKSTKATRIRENGDIFSFQLDELDMAALSSLDQGEPGRTFRMSVFPGVSDHPEAPF
ncbi:LOW QUALITY PROTEIN: 1,5-anhydro-D-fructose reductase-like [Pollicipes pollicipes]|uniref:LOW QUALITY PROTEIN: 1,5-anhydro-D-fructose reductase-like n=1 Tax=Pollicipes pollicipes TaxID=41117 RepID=UPI0018859925|nr:LOW QUALITY PROTEIN: 1,5-anhydro-D-fructose reductase-like [Pollicipes pollicipes]